MFRGVSLYGPESEDGKRADSKRREDVWLVGWLVVWRGGVDRGAGVPQNGSSRTADGTEARTCFMETYYARYWDDSLEKSLPFLLSLFFLIRKGPLK